MPISKAKPASKSVSSEPDKEKLRLAARKLVREAMEKFLTGKNESAGIYKYETFSDNDIGLTHKAAKEFLDYMACLPKYPCLDRRKDPREDVFEGDKKSVFSMEYFIENTIHIWNLGRVVYE